MLNCFVSHEITQWYDYLENKTGTNITTKEDVAIKLEDVTSKHPQLHIESKFYRVMAGGSKFFLFIVLNHTDK